MNTDGAITACFTGFVAIFTAFAVNSRRKSCNGTGRR